MKAVHLRRRSNAIWLFSAIALASLSACHVPVETSMATVPVAAESGSFTMQLRLSGRSRSVLYTVADVERVIIQAVASYPIHQDWTKTLNRSDLSSGQATVTFTQVSRLSYVRVTALNADGQVIGATAVDLNLTVLQPLMPVTLVLDPSPGSPGQGGVTTAIDFNAPVPVTGTMTSFAAPGPAIRGFDAAGNIYLAGYMDSNVYRVSSSTGVAEKLSFYSLAHRFLGVDPSGNLYSTERKQVLPNTYGSEVQKRSPNGTVLETVSVAGREYVGIQFRPNGERWLTMVDGFITKWAQDGTVLGHMAHPEDGRLIDSTGAYWLNQGTQLIKYSAAGALEKTIDIPGLVSPQETWRSQLGGCVVDAQDNIWVSNRRTRTLLQYGPDGTLLKELKAPVEAQLFVAAGSMWIMSMTEAVYNLFKLSPSGDIIGRNGTGTAIRSTGWDPQGNLWILGGGKLYKFSP